MNLNKPKNRIKGFGKRLFAKFFGFETGIDIANDVAVLYRRNIVIKNIVFVSNLLYSIIFFVLGFAVGNPTTDWILAIATLPITFGVGKIQEKLINLDPNDLTKQQVAMYVSSFWIFISAMLVYLRIYLGGQNPLFETASYVLIYYALVEISLYQDKRVLSNSFVVLFGFITLIHITVTYNFFNLGLTWQDFANALFTDIEMAKQVGALLLRTAIFVLFYLVNYIIVAIGQSIQDERKKELTKRREVQSDFAHMVKNLFDVVFSTTQSLIEQVHAEQVASISRKLAVFFNLSEEHKKELDDYVLIHLNFNEIKDMLVDNEAYDSQNYDQLKQKTELGARIGKRVQLAQKCNDMLRKHYEGAADDRFISDMKKIQPEIISQIILLSDSYISLRGVKTYSRPYTHKQAIEFIQGQLSEYFDYNLKETFFKYGDELNELYHNL